MRFSDIIGHKELKQRLVHSVRENRISHAQLFLGAEGTGTLPLAIAFAQYISCSKKTNNDSCGECGSCIKFSKFIHPDVHFSFPVSPVKGITKPKSVDFIAEWRKALSENSYLSFSDWTQQIEIENKQPQISVDESSDIVHSVSLKSFEGGYKFVIIWFPEKMHTSAANKLLKTLEEPEPRTLFLLVSENYEHIIRTISSRTQLVQVNRIAEQDIADALEKLHGINSHEAKNISRRAEGNYNLAMKMLERQEVAEDNTTLFLEWMRMCHAQDYKRLVEWTEYLQSQKREGQKNFISFAINLCRECMMINYADPLLVVLSDNEKQKINLFAPFININNAQLVLDEFSKAFYHVERNANPKILFMDLSIRMQKLLTLAKPVSAEV
ncbi:MAG: DNA polymerase III subunit delta [Bacteroidia bacterium]|nr:DNA polymerase III subunit delta [Bacteroidia bacterium]